MQLLRLAHKLFEPIAGLSSSRTVHNHTLDLIGRTVRLADISAGVLALVGLHDTWVLDWDAGGDGALDANAAVGFLEDGDEDVAVVDAGFLRDGFDGGFDVFDFFGLVLDDGCAGTDGVRLAALGEGVLVVLPQVVEGEPFFLGWPAGFDGAVAFEHCAFTLLCGSA